MNACSLILEGGGMRGVYTAGVLEYFMEQGLEFPCIYGVSAGACQAMSFVSCQPGRNKEVSIGMVNHPKYIRYKGILDGTGLFNMDFIFDDIPNRLVKYDYDAFHRSNQKLIAVATDCETGKAVYLDCNAAKDNITANLMIRASSSLPVIAPIVQLEGKALLDGGIADSIPIRKAIEDGFEKHVVVMTRPVGYRKEPGRHMGAYQVVLGKKYAAVVEAMRHRHENYNESLDVLEQLQKENRCIIIQPTVDLHVKRAEKDVTKLEALYQLGYENAKAAYQDILNLTSLREAQNE